MVTVLLPKGSSPQGIGSESTPWTVLWARNFDGRPGKHFLLPLNDFGPLIDMAHGVLRPWVIQGATAYSKRFWEFILPHAIHPTDQRNLQRFVKYFVNGRTRWAYPDAADGILTAYEVMAERTEVPVWTVQPSAAPESRARCQMIAVPFARLETLEIGWAGLIGIHRTMLQAAHFEPECLKRCVATRTMPLVSFLTMWTQVGAAQCLAEARNGIFQPFVDFETLTPVAYGHESPGQYCYIDQKDPVGWILPIWPIQSRAVWDHHNHQLSIRCAWGGKKDRPRYSNGRPVTTATLLNDRLREDPTRDPTTGFEEWEALKNKWAAPVTGLIAKRTGRYLAVDTVDEILDTNGLDERRNVPTRRRPAPQYRPTPYHDALEEWPAVTGTTNYQPPEGHDYPLPTNTPPRDDIWGIPSPRPIGRPAPGERSSSWERNESGEDEPVPWQRSRPPIPPGHKGRTNRQVSFAGDVEEAERLPTPPPEPLTVEPSDAEWCLQQAAAFVAQNGPQPPQPQIMEVEEVFEDALPESRTMDVGPIRSPSPLSPRLLPIRLPNEDKEGITPPRRDLTTRTATDPKTERKERRQERRYEAQMLDLVFTPSMDETSQDEAIPTAAPEGTNKRATLRNEDQQELTHLVTDHPLLVADATTRNNETPSPPNHPPEITPNDGNEKAVLIQQDTHPKGRNEETASTKPNPCPIPGDGKAISSKQVTNSRSEDKEGIPSKRNEDLKHRDQEEPTTKHKTRRTTRSRHSISPQEEDKPGREGQQRQRFPEDRSSARSRIATRDRNDRSISALAQGIQKISLVPEAEKRRQRRLPEEERDTLLIEMTRRQAQLVLGQTENRSSRYASPFSGRRESNTLPPSQRERRLLADRSRSGSSTSNDERPSKNESTSETSSSEEASPPRRNQRESRAQRRRNRSPVWRRDRRGHSYVRCYRPNDTEDEEERRRERRAQRRVTRRRAEARSPSHIHESITPRHHRDTTSRPRHHHR